MEHDFKLGSSHVNDDLRGVSLVGLNLFDCDLRGANLYNATISLTCDTFHGVKLSDLQIATLLRLIALANITPAWKTGIQQLVTAMVGPTKSKAIDLYLDTHIRT